MNKHEVDAFRRGAEAMREAAAKICREKSIEIKAQTGGENSWTNLPTERIGQYVLCDELANAIDTLASIALA